MHHPLIASVLLLALLPAETGASDAPVRWGADGHRMVGEAAARALPGEMPSFFRGAAEQLAYLNPEPDRWRERAERDLDPAMDNAHAAEHYINFEPVPANAFQAPHRFAYLDSLRAAGIDTPGPGLLPWRILEMTQRLRVGFRLWRAATEPAERLWIEQRILNDAGLLGHYVADGSNPHHTSIHHNGWVGPNPRGYTTERGFHSRFESVYVRHNLRLEDVQGAMGAAPRVFPALRPAVLQYLRTTHSHLERLYQLDAQEAFGPATQGAEHRRFTADRLAAGAEMLRDLWWTAWVTSEAGAAPPAETTG
jgi:hypothetical protein